MSVVLRQVYFIPGRVAGSDSELHSWLPGLASNICATESPVTCVRELWLYCHCSRAVSRDPLDNGIPMSLYNRLCSPL